MACDLQEDAILMDANETDALITALTVPNKASPPLQDAPSKAKEYQPLREAPAVPHATLLLMDEDKATNPHEITDRYKPLLLLDQESPTYLD